MKKFFMISQNLCNSQKSQKYLTTKIWSYTVCYTAGTLKICPNLNKNVQLVYIVTDMDYDNGKLFYRFYNICYCFYNISMTISIALVSIMGLYNY